MIPCAALAGRKRESCGAVCVANAAREGARHASDCVDSIPSHRAQAAGIWVRSFRGCGHEYSIHVRGFSCTPLDSRPCEIRPREAEFSKRLASCKVLEFFGHGARGNRQCAFGCDKKWKHSEGRKVVRACELRSRRECVQVEEPACIAKLGPMAGRFRLRSRQAGTGHGLRVALQRIARMHPWRLIGRALGCEIDETGNRLRANFTASIRIAGSSSMQIAAGDRTDADCGSGPLVRLSQPNRHRSRVDGGAVFSHNIIAGPLVSDGRPRSFCRQAFRFRQQGGFRRRPHAALAGRKRERSAHGARRIRLAKVRDPRTTGGIPVQATARKPWKPRCLLIWELISSHEKHAHARAKALQCDELYRGARGNGLRLAVALILTPLQEDGLRTAVCGVDCPDRQLRGRESLRWLGYGSKQRRLWAFALCHAVTTGCLWWRACEAAVAANGRVIPTLRTGSLHVLMQDQEMCW